MSDHAARNVSRLARVSNALVGLHKEQFGRGPTRARTEWAGRDALVCFLEDGLLPAEQNMVRVGAEQRVREQRAFYQAITADKFIAVVEEIIGRKVRSFSSALDAQSALVIEVYVFEPGPAEGRQTGTDSEGGTPD